MDFIDAVYYINLDHRTDRLDQIQAELDSFGFAKEKLHRISAVYTPEVGVLGCALSHIKALDQFLDSKQANCIVLEDDFMRSLDKNYVNFLFRHIFQTIPDFSLVMLAGKVFKQTPHTQFLQKVEDAQTTSAYLISREFAPVLRKNLAEGADLLKTWFSEHKTPKHEYCLDIYWKQLQPTNKWYILSPKLGVQRESYSDIEKKVTNYGV